MTLKVVEPIDINEAVLTASDIPEPDPYANEIEWLPYEQRRIKQQIPLIKNDPEQDGDETPIGTYTCIYDETHPTQRYYQLVGVKDGTRTNPFVLAMDENFNRLATYDILATAGLGPTTWNSILGMGIDEKTKNFVFFIRNIPNLMDKFDFIIYTIGSINGASSADSASRLFVPESYKNRFQTGDPSPVVLNGVPLTENKVVASVSPASGYPNVNLEMLGIDVNYTSSDVLDRFPMPSPNKPPFYYNGAIAISGGYAYYFQDQNQFEGYDYRYDENIYYYIFDLREFVPIPQIEENPGIISLGEQSSPIRDDERPRGVGHSDGGFVATRIENGEIYAMPVSTDFVNAGSYKEGDLAVVIEQHLKYQCIASETFSDPRETATDDASAEWLLIGPSNKWAMFDDKNTTQTISSTDFSVTIDSFDYVNTIAFFNLSNVESVDIEVQNAGGDLIYNESFSMLDVSSIYDYYTYFFYRRDSLNQFINDNLPPYVDPVVKVTFIGTSIGVGNLTMGFGRDIGIVLADTKTEPLDYSTQEYDVFGNLNYVERPQVKLNTYEVLADKSLNDSIQKLLESVRGKNTLWVGAIGGGQKLVTYGRYQISQINYNMPTKINYSITVRGSI